MIYRVGLVEYEVSLEAGTYEAREPQLPEEASRVYLALLDYYAARGTLPAEEAWIAADRLGLRSEYEKWKAAVDYWLERSTRGWGPLHPFLIDRSVDAVSVRHNGTAVRWRGRWLRASPRVDLDDARRLVDGLSVAPLGSVRMLSGGLRARVAPGEVLVWRPPSPGGPASLAALVAAALLEGESVILEGPPGQLERAVRLVVELLRDLRIAVVDPYLRVAPEWAAVASPGEAPESLLPDIIIVWSSEDEAARASEHAPTLLASTRRARGGWESLRLDLRREWERILEDWLARHPGREQELRRLEARALEVVGGVD